MQLTRQALAAGVIVFASARCELTECILSLHTSMVVAFLMCHAVPRCFRARRRR